MVDIKKLKKSTHNAGYVIIALALMVAGVWFFPWTATAIGVTGIVVIVIAIAAPKKATTRPLKPTTPSKRVAKGLPPEEKLLWESRRHPLSLWPWWLGVVALPSVLVNIATTTDLSLKAIVIVGLSGILAFGVRFWLWYVDRVCITNKRLLTVTGILLVSYKTMPLSKLTDLTVNFSRFSTILAWLHLIREPYATLIVESAGQDQALSKVGYVPNGHQVNSLIMERVL